MTRTRHARSKLAHILRAFGVLSLLSIVARILLYLFALVMTVTVLLAGLSIAGVSYTASLLDTLANLLHEEGIG